MPIINTSDIAFGFEFASFESEFEFEATAVVVKGATASFIAGLEFIATSEAEFEAASSFDLGLEFVANGFINGAPNVFVNAEFGLGFEFEALSVKSSDALALFDLGLDFTAIAEHRPFEIFTFNFILDILPPGLVPANYIRLQPRLKVNGVEFPVVSWSVTEDERTTGKTLNVRLARLSDKDLIPIEAEIEFGLGTKTAGVWDESTFDTIIDGGMRQSRSHSISWSDGPGDTADFTFISGETDKMLKAAITDLVIYDSLRQTLEQSDFEPIPDSLGNLYQTELKQIPGLKLYSLLNEVVVNRCGFVGFTTNLPNFPIQRVDCAMSSGLIESIGGYFGMFEPVVFAVDDELWIIDTTITLPSGFPPPKTVTASHYTTLGKSDTRRRVDALLVSYVQEKLDYDYITTRTETKDEIQGDLLIEIETSFREYRKFTQPFVVIRDEVYLEERTTKINGETIAITREDTNYDSQNRASSRRKRTQKLLPDVNNIVLPGVLTMLEAEDVRETFSYAAHPFEARRQYLSRRSHSEKALVAVDGVNQQLDEDYKRRIDEVYGAGNVNTDMSAEFLPTVTIVETATPQRDGTVKIRRTEVNHLLNIVAVDENVSPVGDISTNGLAMQQDRMLVFETDSSIRTTERIESFHAGELTATVFVPLARRRLKAIRTKDGRVQISVIGYDASLRKGMTIRATGRGETIADCIILGRTVSGDVNGIQTALQCKEI